MISKTKRKTSKLGYQYSLEFRLAQHKPDHDHDHFCDCECEGSDVKLLENISSYFNCGKVYPHVRNVSLYRVLNFKDMFNIIIPFFQKTSFYGVKSLNFKDFCSAASLIEKKEHLTIEGSRKLDSLIAGMNNNRK